MNNSFRNLIVKVISAWLIVFVIGCQSDHNKNSESKQDFNTEEKNWDQDQKEVKAAVEKILLVGGNRNLKELEKLVSDKAIIGYSYLKDGSWSNSEITIKEYIEKNAAKSDLKPFVEIPTDYDIIVTEGRVAIVRADAILSRFGVPINRETLSLLYKY